MLSSTLYTKFPAVYYNGTLATNITVRLKFKDIVKKNLAVYYPYTISEGERPDTLAFKYYDDPSYTWLIFLANDIVDPSFDWPLTSDLFERMLVSKYGSVAAAQEKIMFYRVEWSSDDSLISSAAYDALPAINKKYWAPVIGTNNKVSGYQRARVDWAIDTNKHVRLNVSPSNTEISLSVDDVVYQLTSGQTSAQGVVDGFDNIGRPIVKHVTGTFAASKTIYIKNTNGDVAYGACTLVTVISNNLAPVEENYWAPVSAYDYETELNESKKHIYLIDKIYLDAIEKDIRSLLAE